MDWSAGWRPLEHSAIAAAQNVGRAEGKRVAALCRRTGGPASLLDALYRHMYPKARANPTPSRAAGANGENASDTQVGQPDGKLMLRAQVRRASEVDATERHEKQIAALARLIREAAIRRRDRHRRT